MLNTTAGFARKLRAGFFSAFKSSSQTPREPLWRATKSVIEALERRVLLSVLPTPSAPTILATYGSEVDLSLPTVDTGVSFNILRQDPGSSAYTLIDVTTPNASSYSDSNLFAGLPTGSQFHWEIEAADGNSADTSAPSASVSATTSALTATPQVYGGGSIQVGAGFFLQVLTNELDVASASLNFGDGTSPATGLTENVDWSTRTGYISAPHTFVAPGTYHGSLDLTLNDGTQESADLTLNVTDPPPAITVTSINAVAGHPLTNFLVATVATPDTSLSAGDLTGNISWGGDGNSTASFTGSNGLFSVFGNHTFSTSGNQSIVVNVDTDGVWGSGSSNAAITLDTPAAPTVSGTPGASEVTLHLPTVAGATAYQIFRGPNSASMSLLDTVTDGSQTYLDSDHGSGLTPLTTYIYKIRAIHNSDTSQFSPTLSVTTSDLAITPPWTSGLTLYPNDTLLVSIDSNDTHNPTESLDFGDGTVVTAQSDPGNTGQWSDPAGIEHFTSSHAFADSGSYTATLTVTPAAGDPGSPVSYPFTINVLSTIGLNVPGIAATTGVPFAGVVATFPDNGTTHAGATSAQIDWGDGNSTPGTLVAGANGQWNVLGMHSYTSEGTNTISVTVHGITATDATAQGTATVVPPPTVATAATAVLSSDSTYVTLNVLGAEGDQSESGLTYTWTQTSGPSGDSAAVFSDNGTNTAKNAMAFLSEAGTYTFKATIANAAGTTITSSASSLTVAQVATSIVPTPTSAIIAAAGTETFSGVEVDQFGNPMATQPDLTWTVEPGGEGGTIDATAGTYTAASGYGADTVDVADASNSAITGEAGVYDVTAAPAQPTGLTATAAETAAILSWDPQQDAATYNVYRGTSSNAESATPIATGLTDPSFTDTNLTDGTTYYYTIKAINPIGGSSASAEASAAPAAVPVTGLTATPGDEVVNLSWDPALGAVSYNLYEASASGGEGSTPYQMGITGTSFTDANTSSTMTNYYLVQPVYPSGPGEIDSSDETPGVQGEFAAPGAPSGITATANGTNEIDLIWTAPSTDSGGPVDQYIINRSTDNGATFTPYDQVDGTTTTYQDTGAADGTKYYYSITAANAVGNSDDSDAANATTVLAAPDSLTATAASATEIDLSWNNNSTTATGFTISRSTNGGGFTTAGTVDGAATTFNDTNLSPGTSYSYEVVATTATASSAASDPVGTITMPANVSGLTIGSVSSSSASFSWPTVTGASGYEIDRKDSSGDWEIYDSVAPPISGDTAGYEDTGLQDGTAYIYRVLPYNDSGTSDEGSAPTLTATTPLIAPNNVNAVALSPTSIEIVWDDQSSSETGFILQRYVDGEDDGAPDTIGAGVTNYIDSSGLQPETSYAYTVAATNSTGTSAASGSAGATTPALPPSQAAPAAPVMVSATATSSTAINVTVQLPSNAATNLVLEASQGNSNNFATVLYDGIPLQPGPDGVYAVTGLIPSTSYSFRLGAILHGQIVYSTGGVSATTLATPGPDGLGPVAPSVSAGEVTSSGHNWIAVSFGGPYAEGDDPDSGYFGDLQDVKLTGQDEYGLEGTSETGPQPDGWSIGDQWKDSETPDYTPYDYTLQMRVQDANGSSYWSTPQTVTYTDSFHPSFPDAPVLTSVAEAGNLVQITCPVPQDGDVYFLSLYSILNNVVTYAGDGRSDDGSPISTTVQGGPTGTTIFGFLTQKIANSDTYASGVSYYDSVYSTPVPGVGEAIAPGIPTLTNFDSATQSGVHVIWNNLPNNETGFDVYRRVDSSGDGAWTLLSSVAADVTHFDDTTALPGTIYDYQVGSISEDGTIAYSGFNTIGTPALPTVSVSALDSTIDADPETGYLDFHRTGDDVAPLTANINWNGTTATAGKDYAGTLPATVTFAAACQDAVVAVAPANGAPDFATVIEAAVASGAGMIPAAGTTQLNDNSHGLKAVLGNASSNLILQGSSDGKSNTVPLTLTFPTAEPANSTITISSSQSGILDVWTAQYPGATAEAIPWNDGSITWTFGEGSPPPTQLWIGATAASSKINDISFQLLDWQPNSVTTFGPAVADSNPATAVVLSIKNAANTVLSDGTVHNFEVGQLADFHLDVNSPFPASQITGYHWSQPGNVLYNWVELPQPPVSGPMKAYVVHLGGNNGGAPPTGKDEQEIKFFWVSALSGASTNVVSENDTEVASVNINGVTASVSAMFKVSEPAVESTFQTGPPGLGYSAAHGQDILGLPTTTLHTPVVISSSGSTGGGGGNVGTLWSASVDAGNVGGYMKFVQTVAPSGSFFSTAAGSIAHVIPSPHVGLDTSDPYGAENPAQWPANGAQEIASDTPGIPTSLPTWQQSQKGKPPSPDFNLDFSFVTYIMYQPPGGQWVPLQEASWGYKMAGVLDSTTGALASWTQQPVATGNHKFVADTAEPTWNWYWQANTLFAPPL